MSVLVISALAAGAGLGVLVAVAGLRGRQLLRAPRWGARRVAATSMLPRVGLAVLAGLVALAATGWLVGGLLAAAVITAAPRVLGGKAARQRVIDRTEAIATWTEMIRDSIVAASGLEEAIVATAPVVPAPITIEVRTLVRRLHRQRLPDALVAFGEDLDHPSGDLVVAALVLASRMEASDLSGLLTRLAEATRGDARMRIRIEVGRARVRTATKVIVGVVAAAVVFLALANRAYLTVYDTPGGQLVLGIVGAIFAVGGWMLARMANLELPERFRARTGPSAHAGAES
jgi:tight adherence protein B